QPQGHSTSGSHERYKSAEQLEWTKDYDCVNQFKKWIATHRFPDGTSIATEEELEQIHNDIKNEVRAEQKTAWNEFLQDLKSDFNQVLPLLEKIAEESKNKVFIQKVIADFKATIDPIRKDLISTSKKI